MKNDDSIATAPSNRIMTSTLAGPADDPSGMLTMHVTTPFASLVPERYRCRPSKNVRRILATASWAGFPSFSTFAVIVITPPRLVAFGVTVSMIFKELCSLVESDEMSAFVSGRQRIGMQNAAAMRKTARVDVLALVNVATV